MPVVRMMGLRCPSWLDERHRWKEGRNRRHAVLGFSTIGVGRFDAVPVVVAVADDLEHEPIARGTNDTSL